MKIEIWSDPSCPWCFLGLQRLHRALEDFEHAEEVELIHRHFIVDPNQSIAAPVLQYLTAARRLPEDVVLEQLETLEKMGADDGINFNWEGCVQAPSQRIHRVLQAVGRVPEVDVSRIWQGVFRGVFEDGVVISDLEQVIPLMSALGVEEDLVRRAWEDEALDTPVLEDIEALLAMTVDSVPFYLFDGVYGAAGAHPTRKMTQALHHAWEASQRK